MDLIRTRTFEFQLVLLNFELVLLSFQLVTHNSCFTISPAMIAQMYNPTAELIIPTGTQTNEANAESEKQPVLKLK